jgi:bromodomain-containing factor 1
VIKKPMDLSTIKQKLAVNAYDDVSEVNKDMKLMFNNCYTYNPPGTPVHLAGKKLESVWTAKWKSLPPKEVPTQGRDDSEVGSVFEDEGYAEEDGESPSTRRLSIASPFASRAHTAGVIPAEEIARIEGQIAELHRRLDQLRKSKARRSSKSKTPGQPKASKASSHGAAAAASSSKPPKAAKNGSASKPKKPSTGGAAGANGINGSSSSTKKQRRESAATYAEDDGDESEGEVGNVSLAQKQELADKIQEAGPDILQQAIQIIQETTSLGDVSG